MSTMLQQKKCFLVVMIIILMSGVSNAQILEAEPGAHDYTGEINQALFHIRVERAAVERLHAGVRNDLKLYDAIGQHLSKINLYNDKAIEFSSTIQADKSDINQLLEIVKNVNSEKVLAENIWEKSSSVHDKLSKLPQFHEGDAIIYDLSAL